MGARCEGRGPDNQNTLYLHCSRFYSLEEISFCTETWFPRKMFGKYITDNIAFAGLRLNANFSKKLRFLTS